MNSRHIWASVLCTVAIAFSDATSAAQEAPHYAPDDLHLELALGEGGAGGDHVFDRIRGVTLATGDRLVVADLFSHSIRVFDLSGRLLREFGRQGAGPGEFQGFRGFGGTDDRVWVFDSDNQRLTVFSLEGEILREETLSVMNVGRWELSVPWIPLRHGYFAVGRAVPVGSIGDRRPFDPEESLVLARADEEPLYMFGSYHPGTVAYRFDEWPGLVNHVPGLEVPPTGAWAVAGDSLVTFIDGVRGRINLYELNASGAQQLRSVDRGWQARRLPQRQVEFAALEPLRRRHAGARRDQFELYLPEHQGRIERILLDREGRLWMKEASLNLTRDREQARVPARASARWRVLDLHTDRFVAVLDLPAGFDLMQVVGDRLIGVQLDEWDVQTVRVFRLDRPLG